MAEKSFPHHQPPGGMKQVDPFEITSGGFGIIEERLPPPGPERPADEEEVAKEPVEGEEKHP